MPASPGCASCDSGWARACTSGPLTDGRCQPLLRDRGGLPALWSRGFARDGRTGDQHDAFSIAAWLAMADRDGSLATFLRPRLSGPERTVAQVEGWILGVAGALDSFGKATIMEVRGVDDPLH